MLKRTSVLALLTVITIQCASNAIKNNVDVIAPFDIDLKIAITITEEYLIKIEVSNNSDSDIFLPNPGCYPISRILVNEGEVPQQLCVHRLIGT